MIGLGSGGFISFGLGGYIRRVIARLRGHGKARGLPPLASPVARSKEWEEEVAAAKRRMAEERSQAREHIAVSQHLSATAAAIEKAMRQEEKEARANERLTERARGYYMGEMAASAGSGAARIRRKTAAKQAALTQARKSVEQERREREASAARRKVALLNLERAKLAKAKKEARAEAIRQQRIKNLKKARAAKKRKRKK